MLQILPHCKILGSMEKKQKYYRKYYKKYYKQINSWNSLSGDKILSNFDESKKRVNEMLHIMQL